MIYESVEYDPARHLILFVHIRKTGGSSLGAQVSQALERAGIPGGWRHLRMQGIESWDSGPRRLHDRLRRRLQHVGDEIREEGRRLLGLPNASVDAVAFASGHVRVDSVRTGRRTPLMITLVREPVDRLVSEYFFTRDRVAAATRAPGAVKKRRAVALSFEEYAEELMARAGELPLNGQCAYFSREGGFNAARKAIDERFLLAAPTPRMDRFGEMLGAKLGVPMGAPPRRNRGVSRPARFAPDARLRARLEAAMAEDCALYEHVSKAFAALEDRVAAAARAGGAA